MDNDLINSLLINKSKIAGNGLFCNQDIPKGTVIAPMAFEYNYDGNEETYHKKYYLRSDVCRFTNHSYPSNCDITKKGNVIYIVSSTDIPSSEEISVDYFDTINSMDPYPVNLPYIKKELIRLMQGVDLDLFVNNGRKNGTYMDDLLDFSLKSNGCSGKIDSFLKLLRRLKPG